MEKLWLGQYPEGVPAEIDSSRYSSVVEIFEEAVEKFRDKVAYTNFDVDMTFAELEEKSRAFAAYLQNDLGLQKGDRVAIMSPNLLQYPVVVFGTLRAGCTVVNTNPLYTPRELHHQLNDAGAKVICILQQSIETLKEVIDDTPVEKVIHFQIGDMFPFIKRKLVNMVVKKKRGLPPVGLDKAIEFRDVIDAGAKGSFTPAQLGPDDTAFLQYTGGTTGVAKGAQLLHRNLTANVLQCRAWLDPFYEEGKERIITALPMYHIFALTANCLVYMSYGAQNILVTDPRDMPKFVKTFAKYPPTAFTAVNTLFNGLVNEPGFSDLDFSKLKMSLGGGAAVQRAVSDQWKEVTGKPIIEAYGLTETSPAATMNRPDNAQHNGRIGVPLPSTEVACMNAETDPDTDFIISMTEVPQGERGEVCIRGPQVMAGYWGLEHKRLKDISEDGWFRTGDVGVMDEQGFFQIVDRLKDMILVSGFNVFPNEIEAAIAAHPKVLEVACIGIPDDRSGEAVKVFVVKKDDSLTEDELKAYCKEEMTGYKVPKHYEFREELPKTNVGKILRKDLRAEELAKG